MTNVRIYLKSGTSADVKSLTAIKKFFSGGTSSYTEEDFCNVSIHDKSSYAFIGSTNSISISGAEILYLAFSQS